MAMIQLYVNDAIRARYKKLDIVKRQKILFVTKKLFLERLEIESR